MRMLDEKGIGRPSTYAPTITTIIQRGYVMRENKRLYATELGRMVTGVMTQYFGPIVDTEFTAQMEDKLDAIEGGSVEWKQVLREFYPPFEQTLEEAEETIEKMEVRDEPSDVICDKCGANMVYRVGRYGKFLACPNFPDCRNTLPVLNYIDAKCPKCGGRLLEKTSRKNRKFYGCEHFPDCDFVSWELPVNERCPKCGSYMTLKRNSKGEQWHLCANETCRHRVEVKPAEDAE
ncbi:MAG: topoisomerase DNA-binding C4 zinc finger domain-containing protein [Clostridia bacterium]|nr:topoisomerase DNA-binding C4 zinc finger domain-containing protein [Clostridia bacterium]